ncbi:hypothetical protein A2803_02945 [Candidatus Woesebacteria bacterium RIFCSPHIGHO2_01_FULL_44_21]|uniref:Uncharacterized protein n=1 Tax=Candidatus Woesebacteria bacterium RIFCSPHIGHO2_01_FULL_44_21 TaxID=1802503 RepID=A0A1F7Z1S1_9BACT|nr:MAG: hypothetical protein A2803_02945 [Candidatus Woesebacteria bacterium RIFCSPHIGHO2_01_FULL_44_21]OGM69228.1 MAG: hypothetical protein A2897_04435 [Candidatus Woesebacteria bacterium RIFCSPLOWO2_01_FULL_44_24b]
MVKAVVILVVRDLFTARPYAHLAQFQITAVVVVHHHPHLHQPHLVEEAAVEEEGGEAVVPALGAAKLVLPIVEQ